MRGLAQACVNDSSPVHHRAITWQRYGRGRVALVDHPTWRATAHDAARRDYGHDSELSCSRAGGAPDIGYSRARCLELVSAFARSRTSNRSARWRHRAGAAPDSSPRARFRRPRSFANACHPVHCGRRVAPAQRACWTLRVAVQGCLPRSMGVMHPQRALSSRLPACVRQAHNAARTVVWPPMNRSALPRATRPVANLEGACSAAPQGARATSAVDVRSTDQLIDLSPSAPECRTVSLRLRLVSPGEWGLVVTLEVCAA